MIGRIVLLSALFVVAGVTVGISSAHYTPAPGDQFAYNETVVLGAGTGYYYGYTESTVINGSLGVTAVLPNGTESAVYYNANDYQNNQGAQESWTSAGQFTFSAQSFLYVNGTDNQTGYVRPYVWFFMNNALAVGSSLYLLNTPMTVVSTDYDFALDTAAGTNVKTMFAEGNGSYERNDVYGMFNAVYNWKTYFDPGTGYMVGYVYTEQDSNSTGSGFTLTDTLSVTHTSYTLTPAAGPPSSSGSSGSGTNWTLIVVAIVIIVVIVVVIAYALSRSRRGPSLPQHSTTGRVSYAPPPMGPPPPGINLTPSGQPAVQQIIIKETVKVNCRYCGALIDSTAERCPNCGAPRT
ncbi:MAG: zinc ribbon domain-containing protein [Thermoplasmata archaeon]